MMELRVSHNIMMMLQDLNNLYTLLDSFQIHVYHLVVNIMDSVIQAFLFQCQEAPFWKCLKEITQPTE